MNREPMDWIGRIALLAAAAMAFSMTAAFGSPADVPPGELEPAAEEEAVPGEPALPERMETAPGELEPAEQADEVFFGSGAVQEHAGVQVEAAIGEWAGVPAELDRAVTPVRVEIENNSDRPIRVKYGQFKLQSAAGKEYKALTPYKMDESVRQSAVIDTDFGYHEYELAPYYVDQYDFGTDLDTWEGPFDYDPEYYDDYYVSWKTDLPTSDMLRKAVPEGVVKPGGQVSGHLYFEEVPAEVTRLTYQAEIVDADTGEKLGDISIPFTRQ